MKWKQLGYRMVVQGDCNGRKQGNVVVLKTTAPQSQITHYPELSREDIFLLQHFFHSISSLLCTSPDSKINSYRTIILPMALSSKFLRASVLAVAASHLASRYDLYKFTAVSYKSIALACLNRAISTLQSQSSPEHHQLVFATVVMLIILGVFEGNQVDWSKHITGGSAIAFTSQSPISYNASIDRCLGIPRCFHERE